MNHLLNGGAVPVPQSSSLLLSPSPFIPPPTSCNPHSTPPEMKEIVPLCDLDPRDGQIIQIVLWTLRAAAGELKGISKDT